MKYGIYEGTHNALRAEKIRQIWIKEHEFQKSQQVQMIIPRVISFSVGYLLGTQGKGWTFWLISVGTYFGLFYLLRYLSRAWKINLLR